MGACWGGLLVVRLVVARRVARPGGMGCEGEGMGGCAGWSAHVPCVSKLASHELPFSPSTVPRRQGN